ncbi:MAG TPA: hypothetical protein PLE28_00155 [bacterium]|nr:hypothetical protein [bacterium]
MNFFIKIYDQFTSFSNTIKTSAKNLFLYSFIKVYSAILLFINLVLWVATIIMRHYLNQDIAILHYNVDFGIDLIGSKNYLFLIPVFSLFFIILNQIILIKFLKNDSFKFWSHFLLAFLLLFNIFLILILFSIYSINF